MTANLRLDAQALVVELFARIDARDLDGAVALYAEDATFLAATGRAQIRAQMVNGLAANAEHRSRHAITNVASAVLDERSVLVRYTAIAYTLLPEAAPQVRTVLDQEQVIRRRPDGAGLEIAEQRIFGFEPPA